MMRRVIGRALLVVLGLILGLGVFEGAVFLWSVAYYHADYFLEPHPLLGFSFAPGRTGVWRTRDISTRITINSHGLHDVEHSYLPQPRVTRILVLGDSYAAGMEVPIKDLFSTQLQLILKETYGRETEVINAGVTGYDTTQEFLFFEIEGVKYHPDIVLLAFYNENDPGNNIGISGVVPSRYPYYTMDSEGHLMLQYVLTFRPVSHPRPFWRNMAIMRYFFWDLGAQLDDVGVPLDRYLSGYQVAGEGDKAWRITDAILDELEEKAKSSGASLFILGIPGPMEFRHSVFASLTAHSPSLRTIRWDLDRPERELRKYCTGRKIPFFSLRPFFVDLGQDVVKLYYPSHVHWNPRGHRLVAEQAARQLVKAGLL